MTAPALTLPAHLPEASDRPTPNEVLREPIECVWDVLPADPASASVRLIAHAQGMLELTHVEIEVATAGVQLAELRDDPATHDVVLARAELRRVRQERAWLRRWLARVPASRPAEPSVRASVEARPRERSARHLPVVRSTGPPDDGDPEPPSSADDDQRAHPECPGCGSRTHFRRRGAGAVLPVECQAQLARAAVMRLRSRGGP